MTREVAGREFKGALQEPELSLRRFIQHGEDRQSVLLVNHVIEVGATSQSVRLLLAQETAPARRSASPATAIENPVADTPLHSTTWP